MSIVRFIRFGIVPFEIGDVMLKVTYQDWCMTNIIHMRDVHTGMKYRRTHRRKVVCGVYIQNLIQTYKV